ncbi:trypsin-like peptidase domain-containing protein [Nocardia sp. R7R-8]|uniref:trypsin-like peptidase domain-containing protein n=1 Tax=Nocardia sp. R7R-8 TaxID=3459304 RepID=UPI00403DB5AC
MSAINPTGERHAPPHTPGYLGRVLDDDGCATGTCFQTAPGVLVTAWHVLDNLGRGEVGATVTVDALNGTHGTLRAVVVATDSAHDLAVLRSDGALPQSATGWTASDHVPLNEPVVVTGVSQVDDPGHSYRQLDAPGTWAGQTVRDTAVRLGRVNSTSVMPGMSGGPVRSISSDHVVGVVSGRYNSVDNWLVHSVWVARTEDARRLLDEVAPGEWTIGGIGWVYSGGQGRHHFQRYALGRRHPAWRGDLYTGRRQAIRRIVDHCAFDDGPKPPLVVTGHPGSGKSSVLARALRTLASDHQCGVAVHARDAGSADIVSGVAEACRISASSGAQLVHRLAEAPPRGLVVLVDALDEMRTAQDRDESAQLLSELSSFHGIRVVVSTRALATERHADAASWRRSDLVRRLTADTVGDHSVIDLDSDEYFAPDDLTDLIERILAGEGITHSPTASAAWRAYQTDQRLRHAVARMVQRSAGRNYLAAVMTAGILASDAEAMSPLLNMTAGQALPSGVGDILDKVLLRLTDADRTRVGGLLVALSYGRGSGLTDARWISFAHALGWSHLDSADIEELRRSSIADYLLERVEKDGRLLTGLFHRSLSDHLLGTRDAVRDEGRLCDTLLREARETSWKDGYIRRFLPSHVLVAGRSEEFLSDPHFVTRCYPSSVWPVAMAVRTARGTDPAAVLRLALPFMESAIGYNALTLEVTARTQGSDRFADAIRAVSSYEHVALECVEAFPSQVPAQVFVRHSGSVRAVAALARPGNRSPVVVTTSNDGTARVWDPYDPQLTQLAVFHGHTDWVGGVTTLPWPDRDHHVIVTTSGDGTARIWDPHQPGTPELAIFHGHTDWVGGVTTLPWPDRDHHVIVTTSGDGTARVWDPHDPQLTQLAVFDRHTDWVGGVTTLPWPDRQHHVIVTTSGDGTARIWDPYQPETPELVTYRGHRGRVRGVTVLTSGPEPVCVTSSDDGTVQIWAPHADSPQTVTTYDAHAGGVHAAVHVSSGTSAEMMVSVGSDYKAHVWDLDQGVPQRRSARGHNGRVRSAAFLPNSGPDSDLLITTSNDATARIWQIEEGKAKQLGLFSRHTDWVRHLDLLPWPGRANPVAVTAGGDGAIRIWDPMHLEDGELMRLDHYQQPVRTVRTVNFREFPLPLLLTSSADHTVRLINPYGFGDNEILVLQHPDIVRCAITVPAADGRALIAAATGNEVYVWDVWKDREYPLGVFAGHTDWVRDLTAIEVGGGTRVCSVGNDATVRLWNPMRPDDRDHQLGVGHTDWIWGVAGAEVDSGHVVITASSDGTARFWQPRYHELVETHRLPLTASGLSAHVHHDRLVITTNRGFIIYRLGRDLGCATPPAVPPD